METEALQPELSECDVAVRDRLPQPQPPRPFDGLRKTRRIGQTIGTAVRTVNFVLPQLKVNRWV